MKKVTLMLIAALVAVTSWAALPTERLQKQVPMQKADLQMVNAKQVTPTKKAATLKLQAPEGKSFAAKAKAGAKKAPRKAGITDLLTKQFMLCSDYYEYDSEAGGLVEGLPAAGGWPVYFSLDAENPTVVNIEGFTTYAEEVIQASFSTEVSEELQAQGVIATISIPDGQTLLESSYGPILLSNASDDGDIMAYVLENGYVVFDGLWYDVIGGDGEYADYMYSGIIYASYVVPSNGTMAFSDDEGVEEEVPVFIYQDPDDAKIATVYNFAGFEAAVDVSMKENQTFVIEDQPLFYYDSNYGYFYVGGLRISGGSYYLDTVTGVGTENTLTIDGYWMVYSPTKGSIYSYYEPASTITMTEGEFTYPVIPDVAATPADPEIIQVGEYDADKGYGYVIADIPTVDVDDNDLKESKLYYTFYADIEGEISQITFTPDLYVNLEEDLTEIPYTLNDAYDFNVSSGYKIVYLNYDFSAYNQIGVQSIYRGGDEENATEIQWYKIKDYTQPAGPVEATFNFNAMDLPLSANGVNDGNILEDKSFTAEDVTLTISPKDERCGDNLPNRFWKTNSGPQLRVYSGTLTFEVPEGAIITNMVFNYNGKYWGGSNNAGNVTADSGEITDDAANHQATWEGEAQKVVFAIGYYDEEGGSWVSGNSQINSIVVTYKSEGEEEPFNPDDIDLPEYVYDFNDGTMQGWTTIDADDDGFDWALSPSGVSGIDGTTAVFSQSYDSNAGPLTPDNFLVSPKLVLDGCITFYACAQDASYPAEHFSVEVSTKGNEDAADFETVQEWTLTASRVAKAPRKVQGKWYEFSVDLRGYEGQEGYVAIRHFDCTDYFYIVVDNITLKSSMVQQPDIVVSPTEGMVDELSTVTLTFNNYDVEVVEGSEALLYLNDSEKPVATSRISQSDNLLTINFAEQTAKGEYTVVIPEGSVRNTTADELLPALEYHYSIYPKDIVTLPEGVEAETWYYYATGYREDAKGVEISVAINGNDIYVQGINQYFMPEAWVKGTINEDGTVTFETGQYFGAFDSDGELYDMWFVGSVDGNTVSDVTFSYDAENSVLTTEDYVIINALPNEISMYDYYYDVEISKEAPVDPIEAPEGLETETYLFSAMQYVNPEEDGARRAEPESETATFDFNVMDVETSSNDSNAGDITEPLVLTDGDVTLTVSTRVEEQSNYENRFWGTNNGPQLRLYSGTLTFEVPEGKIMTQIVFNNGRWNDGNAADNGEFDGSTWTGEAQKVVVTIAGNTQLNSIVVTVVSESGEDTEWVAYTNQVQVGFDGDDAYIQGLVADCTELWVKATKNEAGQYVIPANQYMGTYDLGGLGWYLYDYYFTAVDEAYNLTDVVLNYNAETQTFTTDQVVALNGDRKDLYYYEMFKDVTITKMQEFAATPADPEITDYKLEDTSYPKAYFNIPAEDVDGNPILKSKLFYTVWIEKDGEEQMFTVTAADYIDVEEDMVEIPYLYNDGYDIYEGGSRFYFNPTDEPATWTKFGVQSIYYGGGERNESNVVWSDGNVTTGIAEVKSETAKMNVVFDLQGRRVAKTNKGLYIMNGKKVVVK